MRDVVPPDGVTRRISIESAASPFTQVRTVRRPLIAVAAKVFGAVSPARSIWSVAGAAQSDGSFGAWGVAGSERASSQMRMPGGRFVIVTVWLVVIRAANVQLMSVSAGRLPTEVAVIE